MLDWKTLISISSLIFFTITIFLLTSMGNVIAKQPTLDTVIDQHNLVILQYHHVSNTTPSSTSVSTETFEKHMAFLAKNYHVIDLDEAIAKIKAKQALPNKSVAITFDDGYANILENAHPILLKYNFPYTVFINPAIINKFSSQLTWPQVNQMKGLATFANHSLDHEHLLTKRLNETTEQWIERIMYDIKDAEITLKLKTGYSKKWLAFPFGEFNQQLKTTLLSEGYIGFGQQSGGVSEYSDFGALPRFPAAGVYSNLDSLEIKLDSFAMPVKSVLPNNNEFKVNDILRELELVIEDKDIRLSALACYFNGVSLTTKQELNKVTVTVNHVLKPGRARINCTAPSKRFNGRFYWYSFPMFTPTAEGVFLD